MQIVFYKSTVFKSKIMANALKGAKDLWTEIYDWLRVKKGLEFKAPKKA